MVRFKIPVILLVAFALFAEAKNPLNFYANKAEEALSAGRYEDALDYARQEIIDYENNPNGYYQAAVSLYALQQPGQSLSMINKAIDRARKDKPLITQCYLIKANILEETGDSIQSLKALNDGLKIDGNNIDLLIERGSFLSGPDNKSALKDFQKVKKLAPGDPRAYIHTAFLYSNENQYKAALDEITRAIAIDNTISYAYALRGMILQQLGYSPDWIRDCLKSFELDKSSLGVILLASAEDNDARAQIIDEIERVRTTSNEYYTLEANLLYTWNALVPAAKTFEEIINLGIAEADTYSSLADCQKRLGFIIEAYTTASKGLDKYPDEISLKLIKAQIGVLAGKGAEVLSILNSLIAQSPETESLYAEKGLAYLSLGRYSEAVEPLATAVMLKPSALNKLYYGDALRLSGDISKAKSEYNDILRMTEEEIANEMQHPNYMYAMAYSGLGQRTNAISAIKALSQEQPQAEISYMPSVYARLGLKDEAIAALKAYTQENSWNALLDLYSYNFYVLHSEPGFVELLANNGVPTKYNELTHLLEYEPGNVFLSSGGTSMEEVTNLLYENPSDWVKAFNELCPIDMGIGGQIMSVEFNDETATVTYNCSANPISFNFNLINNNPSYKRKKEDVMTLAFLTENPKIADLGITFKYNFTSVDGSGSTTFVINPSRMKELQRRSQSQEEVDQMTLDFWLEEDSLMFLENQETPGGSVKLDGNVLTYIFPASEDDGSMSRIELFKTDIKNQFSNLFKDPSMRSRIPVYVRQNLTLKYIFKGNTSGKEVEFIFTPEELSDYLK